jgi:hypothetical protein
MRSCWSLKFVSYLIGVLICYIPDTTHAQYSLPNEVPVGDKALDLQPYLFPINPGSTNFLAGTMGELRSTHFHAGIDVRTNSMIGAPVLATQQGYISRIIVGAYGYGHAVIITHPDGNSSLYGHLDKFKGPVAAHVLKEHYTRKSFDLDLNFTPDQFPVQRGDTIGLSGNTGGSAGPHLHFEIRDSNNFALNPLAFGFTEIKDVLPPFAIKVALTTMDINSRINDRFGRFEFNLVKSGNSYILPNPIFANGKIGIELLAHDRIDRSQFRCGINYIELLADSTSIFTQEINQINFEESYDIPSLMDFKSLKTRGLRFNKLYVSDGNPLSLFKNVKNQGLVTIHDGLNKIQIRLRDFSGNETFVKFSLKQDPLTNQVSFLEAPVKPIDFDLQENTMTVNSKVCPNKKTSAQLYANGTLQELEAAYTGLTKNVFLIDTRKIIPDSIRTCAGTLQFQYKDRIPSGTDYNYYSDWFDVEFKKGNLYDTMLLNTDYEFAGKRERFTIGNLLTPMHQKIKVTLKPKQSYPLPEKTSVYHLEGKRYEYLGGQWVNGKIEFETHELGDFTLATDSIPPSIRRIYCTKNSARFRISDNLTGISSFEANINGEWLLMIYDYKTGIIQSERQDKTKLLKGKFELKVTDRAGNQRVYQQVIL